MKALIFFFLLALAMELVLAEDTLTFQNCENLGIEDCDGFRQLDLTEDEQKELFSSLLEIRDSDNIHDFIFDWNTNLDFNQIPYTVSPRNYKTIRDAWHILSAIMPSVLYSNTLYNNYSGYVQSNYDYDLTRPSTYFNGAWSRCTDSPPTSTNDGEQGDCRTEYPANWDQSSLNVYLNGGWIGNSALTSFTTTDESNNFQSTLNIKNKIQRDHYKWERGSCCRCDYCCWSCGDDDTCCGRSCNKCGCETYDKDCEYSSTDYRYDDLTLTDSKTSTLEGISYSNATILLDDSRNTAYFTINTTNIDRYSLNLNGLELIKNNLEYTYDYSYLPNNILTAKAIYNPSLNANVYSSWEQEGNYDLITFSMAEQDSYICSLDIFSYFNQYSLDCNVTSLPLTELNITTDKFFYMPNETIKINISIKSQKPITNKINVRYGNFSINITGNASIEIPAKRFANQIKSVYETDYTQQSASAVKTISVYSGENPRYYIMIFWFVISFLVFISALRMCWIKVFGVKNE